MTVAAKICGIGSEAAMAAAVVGGARYVGLVFYPPSPRYVAPDAAAALAAPVPAGVEKVGLLVDADDATIAAILDRVALDRLQLHGAGPGHPRRGVFQLRQAQQRCLPRRGLVGERWPELRHGQWAGHLGHTGRQHAQPGRLGF